MHNRIKVISNPAMDFVTMSMLKINQKLRRQKFENKILKINTNVVVEVNVEVNFDLYCSFKIKDFS